jgi:hypothetical protein
MVQSANYFHSSVSTSCAKQRLLSMPTQVSMWDTQDAGSSNSANAAQFAASGTSSPVPCSALVFKGGATNYAMSTKQWAGLVGLQLFRSIFIGVL